MEGRNGDEGELMTLPEELYTSPSLYLGLDIFGFTIGFKTKEET
jgi:hypothetical protein